MSRNWSFKVNGREVYGWKKWVVLIGMLTFFLAVWLVPGILIGMAIS